MKKLLAIILAFSLSGFSQVPAAKAAEAVKYSNEVKVSVQLAASPSITTNGDYQLKNKDTGVITSIPAHTSVSFKKDTKGITASFGTFTQSSGSGFNLEEIAGSGTSVGKLSNGISYRGSFSLAPNGSSIQIVNYLDMEDYLKGVVPNEMPASWHKEALKAQAIAARSYAANMMMLTTTATSQVYRGYSGEDGRSNIAIQETDGLLVKYNGKPIQTFFFSTSGGKTANVGDVWNSDQKNFPYLVSVDDPYETSVYKSWSETFTPSQILASFGFTGSSVVLYDIQLTKTGANGEVSAVTVKTSAGDKTVKGNESVIRKLFPLSNSSVYNMLYSNWFDIQLSGGQQALSVQTSTGTETVTDLKGQSVQTASGQIALDGSPVSIQTSGGIVSNEGSSGVTSITVTGKGWGHRIGMSQYGAKGYAERGWTAEQILTHYFKGTTVSK
ncbi:MULTISPECIES: SpoIID/LytB domain-containing protein [Bacillaceae]|uniref:SpoIID/LytB domain-containing protein n=1 Tax=Bacillaceae TaxID=186817 RepID=UPI002964D855|nr:SpoIID/LytB domain-containing protein [Bacillus infantis]MDW2876629.1 SpoIID/LytB domain-containing protein [Bacillus infantis]